MANLLTITKLDNAFFRFTLNGDTSNAVENIRNDLTIVAGKCHFKSANGANIIKEQDIVFSNVTLVDGVTVIVPTSNSDLIDQLTDLDFFSWINSSGGSGVDRFEDLLDGFTFFGKTGQFARVNSSETQLEAFDIGDIPEKSTDLTDMPSVISPDFLLIGNDTGDGYVLFDPLDLPVSNATQDAINTTVLSTLTFLDYPPLTSDGIQDFEVPAGKIIKMMYINGAIQLPATSNNIDRDDTFTQSGTTGTLKQDTYTGYLISLLYQ